MALSILVELIDKQEEGDSVDYCYRILTSKDIPQSVIEREIIKGVSRAGKISGHRHGLE